MTDLTIIIPFLNEGIEIRNTVRSIRDTAGDEVLILLINDASQDSYDYESVAFEYNTSYHLNTERQGVAGSRDIGVSLINTEYFLLIDGHMRFYQNNWWIEIVKYLKNDDRAIYCCQCVVLESNGERSHDKHAYGTYIDFLGIIPYEILDAPWITYDSNPDNIVCEIPCVMGASYAVSKRYWIHIMGLAGLRSYGCDEQYMSLKTWLEGGKCILLKNIEIGHIFRDKQPYKTLSADGFYNKLLIAETVIPEKLVVVEKKLKEVSSSEYYLAKYLISKNYGNIMHCKEYYKSIFTKSLDYFILINNQGRNNFDLVHRFLKKLDEISKFLISVESDTIGLMHGELGKLLFLYEYSNYTENSKISDYADEKLLLLLKKATTGGLRHYNLNNGSAGIGVALQYLNQKGYIDFNVEEYFDEIEFAMNEFTISELSNGNIDYYNQSLGVEYYFSKKEGYKFKNINFILDVITIKLNEDQTFFSYSKTLSFITYIWQLGFKGEKIHRVIYELIEKIKSVQNDNKIIYDSGDLINAYTLFKTALVLSDNILLKESQETIEKTCKILDPIKGYVWDAGLIRGSAGTSLIYYLMYQYCKSDVIYKNMGYWFNDILDKAIFEEGIAGFICYEKNINISFIDGVAGIGMTIISILKGEIPEWKEWLML